MDRPEFKVFQNGRIGGVEVANRLVRGSTFDGVVWRERKVTESILSLYGELAAGGVGLIITGNVPVMSCPKAGPPGTGEGEPSFTYVRVPDYDGIAAAVHEGSTDCKVFAMLMGHMMAGPSAGKSPGWNAEVAGLSLRGIKQTVECFVSAIVDMRDMGFDGVQLQGAGLHSCLSYFISPFCNHRTDEYGGTAENRTRIVAEILEKARMAVGEFPIVIKVCGTDGLDGGMDIEGFPECAKTIEAAGVDALEISGMPYAPRRQEIEPHSYFLDYAEAADVDFPIILVGGHRDVEEMESILEGGAVDYISLCRPLICEPDLPKRWLAGEGSAKAECISCNSCRYSVLGGAGMRGDHAVCLYKHDKENYRKAQETYASWA